MNSYRIRKTVVQCVLYCEKSLHCVQVGNVTRILETCGVLGQWSQGHQAEGSLEIRV